MGHKLLSGQAHKVLQPSDGCQPGPLISGLGTVYKDLGKRPKVSCSTGLHINEKFLQGSTTEVSLHNVETHGEVAYQRRSQ